MEKCINLAVDSFVFLVPFSPLAPAVIRTVRQPVNVTLAGPQTQSLAATL